MRGLVDEHIKIQLHILPQRLFCPGECPFVGNTLLQLRHYQAGAHNLSDLFDLFPAITPPQITSESLRKFAVAEQCIVQTAEMLHLIHGYQSIHFGKSMVQKMLFVCTCVCHRNPNLPFVNNGCNVRLS